MRGPARGWRAVAARCLVALALTGVGCASDSRTYYWSSYQWDSYSGPAFGRSRAGPETKKFEATLERIIERSDAAGRRTPPGVLAEYGYLFFKRGEMESAVRYFEREAREWPESAAFMNRMIEQAKQGSGS